MSATLLAGDIGGTKANLALFEVRGGCFCFLREASLPSGKYPSPAELLRAFLGAGGRPLGGACLGVPGPVRHGKADAPNLPWSVDAEELRTAVGAPRLLLVNDLLATAQGLRELPEESFALLQAGRADPRGAKVLIAAGTGLGEAFLVWDGRRHAPCASEGGHADFAPRDEVEIDLLRYLAARFGRVSFERVVSGPGLQSIYRFLVDTGRGAQSLRVRQRMEAEDPSKVISEEALSGTDPTCSEALALFVRAYGGEAGNLALKALATGGVYVGGGIAPKILPKLQDGAFLEAFLDKGRLSRVLAEIPVRVVLDPKTALYGAARLAAEPGLL